MPLGGTTGVFPGTELRLRPRGPKPPAAHEVDLDSVAFAEGASLVDCGHRLAAYLDGVRAERALERRKLGPPGEEKAPVSAGRAAPANVLFNDDDVAGGVPLLQPGGGPQGGGPAAGDPDVCLRASRGGPLGGVVSRAEEHKSQLQSRQYLVFRPS